MCDDHGVGDDAHALARGLGVTSEYVGGQPASSGIDRRGFLRLGAAAGVASIALGGPRPGLMRSAEASALPVAPAPSLDGTLAHRTAQHIHARGSEGTASMTAQAAEAAQHVEAMWFTDHDWREAGVGAPTQVHFTSLTGEKLKPNKPWLWQRVDSGLLDQAGSSGGIDLVTVNKNDPIRRGALTARAVGASNAAASLSWLANDSQLRSSMRTPAHGQTWTVDIKLLEAGPDGWGFIRVALSYHPATGGRPNSYNFIEYRFGPFAARGYSMEQIDPASVVEPGGDDTGAVLVLQPGEQALLGVVWVPQQVGAYQTQTLDFCADIARLFPGTVARDNCIRGAWFGATSRNRAPANVLFDYLRMSRITGQPQFVDRLAITREIAPRFPGLALYNGTEISYNGGHRGWLGGTVTLPNYNTQKTTGGSSLTNTQLVQSVLAGGGMPIANHPFGTSSTVTLSPSAATTKALAYVQNLLLTNAEGGLQGLETFYQQRAGASLEQHWWLARMAIRNGLPLTLTGASDDHGGQVGAWASQPNRFVTGIHAASVGETDLIDALRRGRAYGAEIGSYDGQLDLALDDRVVMGQIDVRPGTVSRRLTIQATALTAANVVEIYQIPIDGSMSGEPGGVVAVLSASAFASGPATIEVDTTRDSAFAVMVGRQAATGAVERIAGSNPVWHLTQEPTWTIPGYRRAS